MVPPAEIIVATEAKSPLMLRIGHSRVIGLPVAFSSVHVTTIPPGEGYGKAPLGRVVDALVLSDHKLLLQPEAVGNVNIDFFDNKNTRVAGLDVTVINPAPLGRFIVHNGKRLSDTQVFVDGELVDETYSKATSPDYNGTQTTTTFQPLPGGASVQRTNLGPRPIQP
jgi:hypothetical protein